MKKSAHPTDNADTSAGKSGQGPEPLVPIEPSTVTTDQLEELKSRAAKADEHWERLLRTAADLENFRKRAAREKQDAIRYANYSLLEKLVPILDNFDSALAAAHPASTEDAAPLRTGIAMIYEQFRKALADAGLEEVDATGQKFDPNWHEAVSQQETDSAPEGHVIAQIRKGYKLQDRLLRPASVVVAKTPEKSPHHPA